SGFPARGWGTFYRRVEREVLDRFIDCGDLHQGFARIHCDECGHEYLLAFSCKTRYFCPSCHQKRMLAYGEWVEDEVLYPVPHRQYVFTLPKLLRPH
ncbi:MAG: transposase zinc-binding domain-containing protein, partial [Gammaproteobacteria bacterium]|nr:transposase zinc-binding domain-containing protein [Gammaproteobacteria bacterium]